MRVLLDTCAAMPARDELRAAGYDVVWAGDWPADPGDDEILAMARREGRVVITLDKDFGELAVVRGEPHAGIVRLVGLTAAQQGPLAVRVLALYAEALAAGAILTVSPGRVRVRDARPE